MLKTDCVVAGGGPAGIVLGLLLARGGVRVTVLEKHSDFLRDFRGDTVHPATLTLLDELGLGERFDAIPHRVTEKLTAHFDAGEVVIADMRRLSGRHRCIAFAPQWDLLEMLSRAAASEPSFTLVRDAEVTGLTRSGDTVTGVEYTDRRTGERHELRATLTVACDGRDSVVRDASALPVRRFGVPIDVWWFRLPRRDDDPVGALGRVGSGRLCVLLDRGDQWQCAYLIGKGSDARLRAEGIESLRADIGALLPWASDRLDAIADFDDVKLLSVELNRARRWYTEGLLLIGDAAHAMSPVGGVGINLAVADAVAAATRLAPALRADGPVPRRVLRTVQRRRIVPTVLVQTAQRAVHRVLLGTVLAPGAAARPNRPAALPFPIRLIQRFPVSQAVPARLVGIGPLPEHAPEWARRPPR